jgi:hypothetical protein
MSKPPPRLHFLFAAASPKAVILRRGPNAWTRLLLWNTEDDSVVPGAWFRGFLRPEQASLSPDGSLFAYTASKYNGVSEVGDTWVAISRPPWLSALALWPKDDCYGGTAFVDNRTLIIEQGHWNSLVLLKGRVPKDFTILQRGIGRGAPKQSLPQSAPVRGHFANNAGLDADGRPFQYQDGKLMRGDKLIVDLGAMNPEPEESPDWAKEWPTT